MKENIVVLNSGGFDSICLVNHVFNELERGNNICSLHFKYGNLNRRVETKCVKRVCNKLGINNKIISIPKLSWTKGEFYKKTFSSSTQYLEYRNLIFLSYAISYAESIGATKIYLAVLKSHLGYKDTSQEFIFNMNRVACKSGIQIIAPFIDRDKEDLTEFVLKYHIKPRDYFSCDVPILGRFSCGFCPDCKSLERIKEVTKLNLPISVYLTNGNNVLDPKFQKLERSQPVGEIRLLINNQCQLKCKHCFYGFEDTVKPILPKEDLYSFIKEGYNSGVRHIHFSGKEPLFDDKIFWYTSKINRELSKMTWSVVTNGINIPKYINYLIEHKCERVFLSVDDVLNTNGVRTNHTTSKALDILSSSGIPVEIFIDLHENNKGKIGDIVRALSSDYPFIEKYYIRTIKPIGNASNFELLSSDDLFSVFKQLEEVASNNYVLSFNIGIEYVPILKGSNFGKLINFKDNNLNDCYGNNLYVYLEKFCNRFQTQITLTPDGYVLGCASEVSSPYYDKISVGNIKNHSYKEIIDLGKDKLIGCQKNSCYKCSFLNETY